MSAMDRYFYRSIWALAIGGMLAIIGAMFLPDPAPAQEAGQLTCARFAQYDASTNGATKMISSASAIWRTYICSITINVGGTATNVQIKSGTGTACATNTANLTPNWQLGINGQMQLDSGIWEGIVAEAGQDVCIVTSAGNPVQAIITYRTQP